VGSVAARQVYHVPERLARAVVGEVVGEDLRDAFDPRLG
jgi:hypothetical protein